MTKWKETPNWANIHGFLRNEHPRKNTSFKNRLLRFHAVSGRQGKTISFLGQQSRSKQGREVIRFDCSQTIRNTVNQNQTLIFLNIDCFDAKSNALNSWRYLRLLSWKERKWSRVCNVLFDNANKRMHGRGWSNSLMYPKTSFIFHQIKFKNQSACTSDPSQEFHKVNWALTMDLKLFYFFWRKIFCGKKLK